MLIIKSQLNNGVNCNINFQEKKGFHCLCFTRNFHVVITQIQNLRFNGTLQKCVFRKSVKKVPSRENYGISVNVTPCEIKKSTSVSVHLPCLKFF